MTKPWEETWTAGIWMHDDQQDKIWALHTDTDPPTTGVITLPFCEFDPNQEVRARLAAAAPELVRVLLAVEWEGWEPSPYDDPGGDPCCPACKACKFYPDGDPKNVHRDDCALDAALRKAGVR